MKPLINFQEFEKDAPLHEKISPEIEESFREYLLREDNLNEGFFDDVKNFLSKKLLGSLSYINMIDQARSEILRMEKEIITKRYSYQDEMESLTKSLREATKTNSEGVVSKIKKSMDLKEKEHSSYEKMASTKIEKLLEQIDKMIKGNKRRKEYYEAGKSEDELSLAEFEYREAKRRSSTKSEDLKKLEEEIAKAKEEAKKAQEEMKLQRRAEAEEESKKKQEKAGVATLSEAKPDFEKSLRSAKGTRALLLYLKGEKEKLKDRIQDAKNENTINLLKNEIKKIDSDIDLAEKVLEKHEGKKLILQGRKFSELKSEINDVAKQLSQHQAEREGVLDKNKAGQGEKTQIGFIKSQKGLDDQQKKAQTTGKINKQIGQTNKTLKP